MTSKSFVRPSIQPPGQRISLRSIALHHSNLGHYKQQTIEITRNGNWNRRLFAAITHSATDKTEIHRNAMGVRWWLWGWPSWFSRPTHFDGWSTMPSLHHTWATPQRI